MLPRTPTFAVSCAIVLIGCSANTVDASRGMQGPAQGPPAITVGAGGHGDFGNTTPKTPQPGSAGAAATMSMPRSSCKGGQYVGTYTCDLDVIGIPSSLDGKVSFLLEIDETVVPGADCEEFCPDLVIAEGSGTLFGIAGDTGWVFSAKLDGGLDCQTGEFRANTSSGIYGIAGSNDASDPDALSTVLDPPLGEFDGELSGMHAGGTPESIAGDWDLADAADLAHCSGPFAVELQP